MEGKSHDILTKDYSTMHFFSLGQFFQGLILLLLFFICSTQVQMIPTCCKPCTTWACCVFIWTGVAPLGDCTRVGCIWVGPPCCGNCTIRTWNGCCWSCVPIGTKGCRFVVVRLTVDVSAAMAVGDVPAPRGKLMVMFSSLKPRLRNNIQWITNCTLNQLYTEVRQN